MGWAGVESVVAEFLVVGTRAPSFDALDQNGRHVRLIELRGHPVVLYFYPRDGTLGCTMEACAFRDRFSEFDQLGARVLGISTDTVEDHHRFAGHHRLPFTLLADPDGTICEAYHAIGLLGVARRVTYIIDREGIIRRILTPLIPQRHAGGALRAISGAGSHSSEEGQ